MNLKPSITSIETSQSRRLLRLERLANILDAAIPIGKSGPRIGIDPILGLIPGVGDAIGALISSYIIIEAANLGVSRLTLGRMMLNVAADALVGFVPVLGDLFDFGFKVNQRNIELVKKSSLAPVQDPSKRIFSTFFSTLAMAIAFSVGLITLMIYLIVRLVHWVGQ